jgi:AbrB family looped-hinge helix DNA binding protein
MPLLEVKTAKITDKGQIAIPKDLRTKGGFKEGSKVAILAFDDHIELRPMSALSEGMATALASEKVLAKEWLTKEEDEAWKNL